MHRLRTLFILLATAWELWRTGFDPSAFESDPDDYDIPYTAPPEHLIVLTAADYLEPARNPLHFTDPRRRMH